MQRKYVATKDKITTGQKFMMVLSLPYFQEKSSIMHPLLMAAIYHHIWGIPENMKEVRSLASSFSKFLPMLENMGLVDYEWNNKCKLYKRNSKFIIPTIESDILQGPKFDLHEYVLDLLIMNYQTEANQLKDWINTPILNRPTILFKRSFTKPFETTNRILIHCYQVVKWVSYLPVRLNETLLCKLACRVILKNNKISTNKHQITKTMKYFITYFIFDGEYQSKDSTFNGPIKIDWQLAETQEFCKQLNLLYNNVNVSKIELSDYDLCNIAKKINHKKQITNVALPFSDASYPLSDECKCKIQQYLDRIIEGMKSSTDWMKDLDNYFIEEIGLLEAYPRKENPTQGVFMMPQTDDSQLKKPIEENFVNLTIEQIDKIVTKKFNTLIENFSKLLVQLKL